MSPTRILAGTRAPAVNRGIILTAPVLLRSENVSSTPTTITPPGGANFLLALSLAGDGASQATATSVTWDGNSLTEIVAARAVGSGFESCRAYYLANPALAAASIAYSGHTGNHRLLLYWLRGVNTVGPIRAAGVTNSVDVTQIDITGVASSPEDITISGCALSNQTSLVAGLGLTRDQHFVASGGVLAGGYEAGVYGDASVRWTAGVSGRLAGNLISIAGT